MQQLRCLPSAQRQAMELCQRSHLRGDSGLAGRISVAVRRNLCDARMRLARQHDHKPGPPTDAVASTPREKS